MAVIALKKDNVRALNTDTFINDDGDAERLMDQPGEPIPCDVVPNGAANTIVMEDGTEREYAYTLYLSASCPDFEAGQRVMLERANGETKDAEVLGFHRYQHQAKMWI